jgi:tetratricopeptide (TPR) repeat protein
MYSTERGKTLPHNDRTQLGLKFAIRAVLLLLVMFFITSHHLAASGSSIQSSGEGLTPPTDWEILLQDEFEDNQNDWDLGVSDKDKVRFNWQITEGKYRWEAHAYESYGFQSIPDHDPVEDFYLSVDIRKVAGPDSARYGIVFRSDDDNWYMLSIYDPGQYSLWLRHNGKWVALIMSRKTDAIHPGQINHVELMAVGPEISIAINGQQVTGVNDERLQHGWIGLNTQITEAGEDAIIEFDNLELRGPKSEVSTQDVQDSGDLEQRIADYQDDLTEYRRVGDKSGEAKTLNNIGHNYHYLEEYEKAIDYLQQAINVYESIGEAAKTAYPLDGLGMVYRALGEYETSIGYFKQALEFVQQKIHDDVWEANIFDNLGSIYEDMDEYQLAVDNKQKSLDMWEDIGDAEKQAWALNGLGWNQHMLGDNEQAIENLTTAKDLFHRIDDLYGEAWVLDNLGSIYDDMGEKQIAIDYKQIALDMWINIGNDRKQAWALNSIGWNQHVLGEDEQAIENLISAKDLFHHIDNPYGEAWVLGNLGSIYEDMGEHRLAVASKQKSLELWVDIGNKEKQAWALNGLGWNQHMLGNDEQAIENLTTAKDLFHRIDDLYGEAWVLGNLGAIYEDMGEYQLAVDYEQKSLELWVDIGNIEKQAWALNGLGWNQHMSGDNEQAIENLSTAKNLFLVIDDPYGEAWVLDNLGWVYRELSDFDKALSAMQNAEQIKGRLDDKEWQADTLYDLADLCRRHYSYGLALEYFDEALEISRELWAEEGEQTNLHQIGRAYIDRFNISSDTNDLKEAAVYLERALEFHRNAGNLTEQAESLHSLGLVYENLSDYKKAADYTQGALSTWRAVGDRREEAWALNNIGYYYAFLFDYPVAMDYLQQARQIFQDIDDGYGEGWVIDNMAFVSSHNLGYAKGMEYQLEALAVYEEIAHQGQIAESLNSLGRYSIATGDYEPALQYFQRAGDIWLERGDTMNRSRAVNNVGVAYAFLGDDERAMGYFEQALEMVISIGDRWREATMLGNLGEGYLNLDEPEKALEYCLQAKAIYDEINHPNIYYQAANINFLGRVYQKMGDYDQAEKYLLDGLEMMKVDRSPYGIAILTTDLGEFYYEAGDYDRALEILNQVLQLWRQNADPDGEARTLKLIGKVHEAVGKTNSALDAYLESITVSETILSQVKAEAFQTSLAAKGIDVYQLAIQLLIEMERYEEAFELSERNRARNFLDAMGNKRPDFSLGSDTQLIQQEELLRSEISALEDALYIEKSKSLEQQNPQLINDIKLQLTAKQQGYGDLVAEMQINNPELASLVSIDATTISDTQRLLDDQTTLVSYYLTERFPLAFIISNDDFHVVLLPTEMDKISTEAENFRALGLANLENPRPRSLENLYNWLVLPLKPYLSTSLIGIIPHQVLHYVPFSALNDGETYFSEQYIIFQLPSSSSLPYIQEKTGHELSNPLIVGNPDTQNPDLPPLKFAAEEAEKIAALYAVQPLLGTQASEYALRDKSAGTGIIHIAAHGGLNPKTPMFSRLWLAPEKGEDGQLNVYEVYGLNLDQADLVVLSACQTQHGEVSAGDEIISLNRAFLYGAPTVISSLWSVDDQATGEMMERLYSHLQQGMTKAEALQAAQKEIRNDPDHPEWQHPFYWSAFVINGDPGKLHEVKSGLADHISILIPTKYRLPLVILIGTGMLISIIVLGIFISRKIRY